MNLSIIIPVYNKESSIADTLNSILRQNFAEFEVLAVDDGSTDTSGKIINSIADSRLKYFRIENSGPGSARNYGLKQSSGEWIMFMDADDIMSEGALSFFFNSLTKYPDADMIVGDYVELDDSVIHKGKGSGYSGYMASPFKAWFFHRLHPCAGTFICRKCLLGNAPYNSKFRCYEDVDMLFNIFRKAKIYKFDNLVMEYRRTYSIESKRRHSIETNFICNMDFSKKKSLWEKVCLYEKYIEAKNIYPEEYKKLYPELSRHIIIILFYHIAFRLRALVNSCH